MLRFTYVASVVGIFLAVLVATGRAETPSLAPSQALVRINPAGQLELCMRLSRPVYQSIQMTRMVKQVREEQRTETRKVTKDGVEQEVQVPVTVQVEVMVPETYTTHVPTTVVEQRRHIFPAATNGFRREADKAEIALYDLSGNRLSVTAVEDRLRDWTLVLVSNTGKALDRKYAGLFKATTIVIGIPPAQPATVPPGPPPAILQSGSPSAARDTLPVLTPVALHAEEALPQLPASPEPTFAFAKVWGEKTLALRTESEKTLNMTCMVNREVEKIHEGKPVKVVVCEPRQIEKVIEVRETLRYPLGDVTAIRAPNKEVSNAELPTILKYESLAMVSADGKAVDPLWLRNLREGALVIVAPAVPTMPVAMPQNLPTYVSPPTSPVAPQAIAPQPSTLPPPVVGSPVN